MKRGMWLAAVIVAATLTGGATPLAHAVPAPDIEFIYDTTVRKQYSFANTSDAISPSLILVKMVRPIVLVCRPPGEPAVGGGPRSTCADFNDRHSVASRAGRGPSRHRFLIRLAACANSSSCWCS
jgi:hypothetical protein